MTARCGHNSKQVLEILAAQCVKATFFIIGRMARENPEGVRKVRDAGHSIGTHSQNHPLTFHKMPVENARQEIDDGIASVTAALGDGAAPAPFFRIPGLLRAEGVEEYLASKGIQTWSADFPADDWRHISSSRVYELAINRIEAKGKGILLLHDIQARTVAALPRILQELKARGYRIVHVVPATPERPATPTEPQQWQLHPPSETVAISHWPKIPNFVFAATSQLPAPALSILIGMTIGRSRLRRGPIAANGTGFRCRGKRHGRGRRRFLLSVPRLPCPFLRKAFSNCRTGCGSPWRAPHGPRSLRSRPRPGAKRTAQSRSLPMPARLGIRLPENLISDAFTARARLTPPPPPGMRPMLAGVR